MASLANILPKPKNILKNTSLPTTNTDITPSSTTLSTEKTTTALTVAGPPPYGKRDGNSWVPRCEEDFGGGGAFPEIHMTQYPLEMGRKGSSKVAVGNSAVIPVQVDANGKIRYDVLAKQGQRSDVIVYSQLKDMKAKEIGENTEFLKPSEDEVKKTTDETRAALEKIVNGKIKAAQPKNVVATSTVNNSNNSQFIKYSPSPSTAGYNPQTSENRVIQMVSAPIDPLEPPKHKHKKLPRGPPSPPAPVLHSPPRKVSAKEQQAWRIPPCVSSWKNPKGYTIPLDKRFANDGKSLEDIGMNDNFAKLAEALYVADKHAREEVEKRAMLQQKLAERERLAKEESLRELAQRAREERNILSNSNPRAFVQAEDEMEQPAESFENDRDEEPIGRIRQSLDVDELRDEEARREFEERERIRKNRQKERERELRLSRSRNYRDEDRDISEKIALGVAVPQAGKESLFDQRLFNRTEGMNAGFEDDEAYNIYDRTLFKGSSANVLYRPHSDKINEHSTEENVIKMVNTSKFGADVQFAGADNTKPSTGFVEFEMEQEADPFGLESFLSEAKKGKRAMENIGSRSTMGFSSASGDKQEYVSMKQRKIDFQPSREN